MAYSDEVLADTPLAYWRMGEAAGVFQMSDSSGNARHGSHWQDVTRGVAGLIPGDANFAASYLGSGSNSYSNINTTTADWSGVATATVEAIVKPTSIGTTMRIVSFDRGITTSTNQRRFNLSVVNGKPAFEVWVADNTDTSFTAIGSTSLTAGSTYHVVGTYDGTTIRVYLDGVLNGSTTAVGGIPTGGSASSLAIGKQSQATSNHWVGVIDEVAYYSGALSATRITAHYNSFIALANPQRRVYAEAVSVAIQPGDSLIQRQVYAETVSVGVLPSEVQRSLYAMVVQVAIPLAGQGGTGLSVSTSTGAPIYIRTPGGWRLLRSKNDPLA